LRPLATGILMLVLLFMLPTAQPAAAAPALQVDEPAAVAVELIAEGLTAPLFLASPSDGSGRNFIVDQTGLIYVLTAEGELLEQPFLDLSDRSIELLDSFDERGLIGFVLHPNFAENSRFFVSYSAPLRDEAPAHWNYTRRISEFTVSEEDPNLANPASERVLMAVDWPSRKHNGGALAFGPDGFLYIALGDGGGAHGVGQEVLYEAYEMPPSSDFWDTFAQDIHSLYGKILRIDVDRGYPGYAIPQSNPFVGKEGQDEIYAWGFRNPFRIAFDRAGTQDLFVMAVAETLWESIYLVNQPGNYGWATKEATHCFDRRTPLDPPETCPQFDAYGYPLHDPIVEYANMSIEQEGVQVEGEGLGTANIGGYLYRGDAIPELYGKLVFGDWSADFMQPSGQLFVATPPQVWGELWEIEPLLQLETRIQSMGQDGDGELYLLTNEEIGPLGNTGKVYKVVPAEQE
jgi:glucose/arabinose dehydrogenase